MTAAAELWFADLEQLERLGERSPGTIETYRRQWQNHVAPALGGVRLVQVTPPVVDRFLVGIHAEVGAATARTCRAVVSGVLGFAAREGAVRVNPVRDVRRLSAKPKRRPRALTDVERTAWFVAVARDNRAVRRDLPDLCAFMLATGTRLGEVLAVRWDEVDLDAATVDITSTLIRVTGRGLIRKPTKSEAGIRTLVVPSWCVAMLRARTAVGVAGDEPVFGTVDGGWREPRTVSRWLHDVRQGTDLAWVTSHSWRKTTASILDGSGLTARVIADQLGHSRVSMTQDVYLGRRMVDIRTVRALEGAQPTDGSAERGGQRGGSPDDAGVA
ncbi:MAG: site-specific integrase [Phycicoccus sp.]